MNSLNCTNKKVPHSYYGFIYKTIFPNGKIYIGQTTKRVDRQYFGSGTKVKDYINTNTYKQIKREILVFVNSQKSLNKLEALFICKYNSNCINIGYNIIIGSLSEHNPVKLKVVRDKISKFMSENHPLKGKKFSNEYKHNMSNILKNRPYSGKDNPMFGKKPANFNKIVINNGICNKYINKGDKIPQGYILGMKSRNYV